MKYATAKEFMKGLPRAMYVDLDTANMRSNCHLYSNSNVNCYVADTALVNKVVDKIHKADDIRMSNLADMREDGCDEVFIDEMVKKTLQQFLSSDCNMIIIHETLNFFDNAMADPDQYEDMDAYYLAEFITSKLETSMRVNNIRVVYRTPENVGNDIFYIITTSIDAVTTINTRAAEEFIATEGSLSSFYETLLHVDWYSYNLEDIATNDIIGDMDDEDGDAWTDYGLKHYTSADMKVEQVVDRFCKYITLRIYRNVRLSNLKHFATATQNRSVVRSILCLPNSDAMKENDESNTRLYPELRWVLKQFRKYAYLEGTGKEIAALLQKIYDAITTISINVTSFCTTDYIPFEYITADDERIFYLRDTIDEAKFSIFDDVNYDPYSDSSDEDDDDDD